MKLRVCVIWNMSGFLWAKGFAPARLLISCDCADRRDAQVRTVTVPTGAMHKCALASCCYPCPSKFYVIRIPVRRQRALHEHSFHKQRDILYPSARVNTPPYPLLQDITVDCTCTCLSTNYQIRSIEARPSPTISERARAEVG
jgi:hypothetical protein